MKKVVLGWSVAILAITVLAVSYGNANSSGSVGTPPQSNKPYGLCFGPYVDGSSPSSGAVATPVLVNRLFGVLRLHTGAIRTYTCAPLKNSKESQVSLAKKNGFTIAGGCWLSANATANTREIGYLVGEIKKGNIDLAIVGSEVLYRHDLKPQALIGYINQVKATGATVTIDDTDDAISANSEVVAKLDKLMVNFYPYWHGDSIDVAFNNFLSSYNKIKAKYPDKEIIIGETGWPSSGNTIKQAVPSQANAQKYAQQVLQWANANHIKCYYFEAFDEPWKASAEGPQGAHWGLWTKDSVPKFKL